MKLTPLQRGLLIAGILFALFISNRPAQAQSAVCGLYTVFRSQITGGKYQEQSLGKGLTANGQSVVELFASDETFTILVTDQYGRTCMISAGKTWIVEPPTKKGENL